MVTSVVALAIASTMFWVYAATILLMTLFVLLVAPYLGIYGTRDIGTELEDSVGEYSEQTGGDQ